jgi:molybdopterin-biosynthesis enzyme MoeA-like protein
VTLPAIAAAFGAPLVRHPELARIIARKLGEDVAAPAMRMAEIPEGAQLWWDGEVTYPLVVMRNVHILPGVPFLFRMKFEAVAHRFSGVPVVCARLRTTAGEWDIADALTEAAERWPAVAIGSYPRFEETPHAVIITMEGRDRAALAACEAFLRARIPVQESR